MTVDRLSSHGLVDETTFAMDVRNRQAAIPSARNARHVSVKRARRFQFHRAARAGGRVSVLLKSAR